MTGIERKLQPITFEFSNLGARRHVRSLSVKVPWILGEILPTTLFQESVAGHSDRQAGFAHPDRISQARECPDVCPSAVGSRPDRDRGGDVIPDISPLIA